MRRGKMAQLLGILIWVTLAAAGMAAPPGIQPNTGGKSDRSLTAITRTGKTYLAGRELSVDLGFPSAKIAKGKICILYEPSTGLFLHYLEWAPKLPSKQSCIDSVE